MTIQRRIGKEDNLNLHGKGYMPILSDPEEKKAAESFTSSFPYFVRTMKRFNVSGSYTLNVPYQFSMEYLPKCKTEIVLRNLKGVSWTVNSVPTTRVHTSHTFCGGWLAFVRNNEIKMGDICIFELVGKCEMCVHLFQLGKQDDLDSSNGKAVCNELCVASNAISQNFFDDLPKKLIKNSAKVRSNSLKKVQKCGKKVSRMLDKSKHSDATKISARLPRTGNEKPEACLGLRAMVAIDEQKAAGSFSSAYPNFVRIMKKFNISGSYTLKIPYQFSVAYLPNCKTKIILRNLQGDHWTVNSVPDSKGRMGHTFCGGWMAFVRGNDIKMGDTCIFELTSKWEMYVHMSGHGKKGIEHQLGRLASNEMLGSSATGNRSPT